MKITAGFTAKYALGQTVRISDEASAWYNQRRTITAIEPGKPYPYMLSDGLHYPENEIAAVEQDTPADNDQSAPATWQTMDIDSGLGIGGINNDQSAPFVPSAATIDRAQRMRDTDTICRRCGASAKFDGAMFTTLGGSSICDDCA